MIGVGQNDIGAGPHEITGKDGFDTGLGPAENKIGGFNRPMWRGQSAKTTIMATTFMGNIKAKIRIVGHWFKGRKIKKGGVMPRQKSES
jgi:hypothetical protein